MTSWYSGNATLCQQLMFWASPELIYLVPSDLKILVSEVAFQWGIIH